MTADDLRLTAQLVAAGRIHSVSDAAVMALARRVLELEVAVAAEREACAKYADTYGYGTNTGNGIAEGIRAGYAQRATIAGVSEGNDG